MPRHLRYQSRPWATHLVTSRCTQGYSLLSPAPRHNLLIVGCLSRALEVCEGSVRLHHYAFMSNHYHLVLSAQCARARARFMCHLNSNLARELCRLHGWRDHLWEGRYASAELLDEEAVVAAFKYVFKNSVKEGLVDHPREWPGLHGWAPLCGGERVEGEWLDRAAWSYAERTRRGREMGEEAFVRRVELALTPLPGWEEVSAEEYQASCVRWCEEATREALESRAGAGAGERPSLGAEEVCAQPVFVARPRGRAGRALCNGRCAQRVFEFMVAYRAFRDAFREASWRLRSAAVRGVRTPMVCFPDGGVPFYSGGSWA